MSFDGTMSAHGNTTTWTKPWGNFNIGRLISLKVTVSQAYSGVGALSFDPLSTFGNPPVMDPTQTTLFPWSISVDLRTTGVRTITPTQITGSAGADSLGIAPGNVWFGGPVGPSISRDVSAESPANWPLFEVEIMTDQGFQPSVVTLMGQSWT
jgi:hypothetical protein